LIVASLAFVSIVLVIFQSAFLNACCTLCLASAAISINLVGPVMDEVLASLQHIKREPSLGDSLWRVFWGLKPNVAANH